MFEQCIFGLALESIFLTRVITVECIESHLRATTEAMSSHHRKIRIELFFTKMFTQIYKTILSCSHTMSTKMLWGTKVEKRRVNAIFRTQNHLTLRAYRSQTVTVGKQNRFIFNVKSSLLSFKTTPKTLRSILTDIFTIF